MMHLNLFLPNNVWVLCIIFLVSSFVMGEEQQWLQVIKPFDVKYSYKIRSARNFGSIDFIPYNNIKLIATQPIEACSQKINNGASIRNNVAHIRRGGCSFVTKALNAQMYGAVSVVIYDNELNSKTWIDMIGDGTSRDQLVEIPVYYMKGKDGHRIHKSVKSSGMIGAVVNLPVNNTNLDIVLDQPPWDYW